MDKRIEFRKELAKRFLDLLERDPGAWKRGWTSRTSLPVNGSSGKQYRGINLLYLRLIAAGEGYNDNRWFTFRQVTSAGYKLKNAKGKGCKVEYWYPFDKKERKKINWEEWNSLTAADRTGDRYILCSQYFTVFNGDLIEGLPEMKTPEYNESIEPSEVIGSLSECMCCSIVHDGGDQAFYKPMEDRIHLPMPGYFTSSRAYNATALHELAHATGHPLRLNRDLKNTFGDDAYAFEELIAEMASCFISTDIDGFDPEAVNNHEAYIHCWAKRIRKDPDALPRAVKKAEEAAEYMYAILEGAKIRTTCA